MVDIAYQERVNSLRSARAALKQLRDESAADKGKAVTAKMIGRYMHGIKLVCDVTLSVLPGGFAVLRVKKMIEDANELLEWLLAAGIRADLNEVLLLAAKKGAKEDIGKLLRKYGQKFVAGKSSGAIIQHNFNGLFDILVDIHDEVEFSKGMNEALEIYDKNLDKMDDMLAKMDFQIRTLTREAHGRAH